MRGDAAEASEVAAMMEQGSASALPIFSAAGEAVPVEVSRREGSAARVRGGVILGLDLSEQWSEGVGRASDQVGGPTKSGSIVFALDNTAEGLEWRGLHTLMGGVA